MRSRSVRNCAGACFIATLVSACGGINVSPSTSSLGARSIARHHHTAAFTHLFSFDNADGADPLASLTNVSGVLYGTTFHGGAGRNTGTVFAITTSGMETVLHSFGSFYYDPVYPNAGLTYLKGKLYGSTEGGGDGGVSGTSGTIFKITTSGKESQVYAFHGGTDGKYPVKDLVAISDTLYGVTFAGGIPECGSRSEGCGTVFSLRISGKETVLHAFTGSPDGAIPFGALLPVSGTLYGTTAEGGTGSCNTIDGGCGTVFEIGASGTETVLYNFQGGADGELPESGLTALNGTLYGTTFNGGGTGCSGYGCGTIYQIGTSGTENVIHTFQGGTDGALPDADLVAVNGVLYGTTAEGGGSGCGGTGCGTIFEIDPSGAESVLYSFKGRKDGKDPEAGLVVVHGTLYGTAARGGGSDGCKHGCGTVFALRP